MNRRQFFAGVFGVAASAAVPHAPVATKPVPAQILIEIRASAAKFNEGLIEAIKSSNALTDLLKQAVENKKRMD